MSINTKQFQYKDITLFIGGEEVTGFTEINFNSKRVKEYLYGRGDEPYDIQHGNKKYSGSLELWQDTVERLEEFSPNGDITLLRASMVVNYALLSTGKLSTYRIDGLEFEETSKGGKQGDTYMHVKLPIKFLKVKKVG